MENDLKLTPYTKEDNEAVSDALVKMQASYKGYNCFFGGPVVYNITKAHRVFLNTFDPEYWEKLRRKHNVS